MTTDSMHRAARLVPARQAKQKPFPDLTEFRNSIKLKGKPMSETVTRMRRGERF